MLHAGHAASAAAELCPQTGAVHLAIFYPPFRLDTFVFDKYYCVLKHWR